MEMSDVHANNANPALTRASAVIGQRIVELVTLASIEMSARDAASARAAAELLPSGTSVYVNFLPHQSLSELLEAAVALRDAGFNPVPHLAARTIESRQALRGFLQRAVRDAGVRRVLVIGGDVPQPLGPYVDSLALIREGALAEAGIRELGVAGYPEGHPRIASDKLDAALVEKRALAREQGLALHLVTQFSFAPARVVQFCAAHGRKAPGLPLHLGIAGPTAAATLFKYAQRCGVSASLRALRNFGFDAVTLMMHTDPGEQLAAIAGFSEHRAVCDVAGVHFFSFGGFLHTARWINRFITKNSAAQPSAGN